MNKWLFGLLLIVVLTACDSDDPPLPTQIDMGGTATQIALAQTATREIQLTLTTATPTAAIVATSTWTYTPSLTFTPSRTTTVTPSATATLTTTAPSVFASVTPSLTPTITLTPTLTPTRVSNPDAVVGERGAALLAEGRPDAEIAATLEPMTALEIQGSSEDETYFLVRLMSGLGSGWVAAADVIIFGQVAQPASDPLVSDLQQPQVISTDTAGSGLMILPYSFASCGDTYWGGDGNGFSMESLVYQGRYPRFARIPIRVYVHGLPPDDPDWELAISEAFAQLSQAVQLERVYLDDLEFFHPAVPLETLLGDTRVDMIWHIVDEDAYPQTAPCPDRDSCSQYAFTGRVVGGALRFVGMTYIPENTPRKAPTLIHAAVHALGLWIHSPAADDLMYSDPVGLHLSPRDVRTLRCLYNAPLYGDGSIP